MPCCSVPDKRPIRATRTSMPRSLIDPTLVFAWQAAHSVARSAPSPVSDRGGFRVDTGSEKEARRWVFPQLCDGLREIAQEIDVPRHYLKLSGTDEELRSVLPPRWDVLPANYFMTATVVPATARPLPAGYTMALHRAGAIVQASVTAPNGDLAASGNAAEAAGVFVYDRIETAPAHRRKGLGLSVMAALGAERNLSASTQLLVATKDGRGLYESLGWSVLGPFATGVIPDVECR